jgi:hypothetical protein
MLCPRLNLRRTAAGDPVRGGIAEGVGGHAAGRVADALPPEGRENAARKWREERIPEGRHHAAPSTRCPFDRAVRTSPREFAAAPDLFT